MKSCCFRNQCCEAFIPITFKGNSCFGFLLTRCFFFAAIRFGESMFDNVLNTHIVRSRLLTENLRSRLPWQSLCKSGPSIRIKKIPA